MADTQRTITELKAVLPDNITGEISAQDVRDIVESMKTGHAEMYVTSSTPTTIASDSVFYKVLGTTTLSTTPTAVNWDMPADNRLRYTGTAARLAKVSCSVTLTTASNIQEIRLRLAKNGTAQVDSEIYQLVKLSSEEVALTVTGLFEVSNGNYIELYVANYTSASNLTVLALSMDVISFAI